MDGIKQRLKKALQRVREDEQFRAAVITLVGIGIRLLLKR